MKVSSLIIMEHAHLMARTIAAEECGGVSGQYYAHEYYRRFKDQLPDPDEDKLMFVVVRHNQEAMYHPVELSICDVIKDYNEGE